MKIILLPLLVILFALNLSALDVFNFNFNDANGTALNAASAGAGSTATFNNGGAQIQTRSNNSGHANIGYTHYYNNNKTPFGGALQTGSATGNVFRTVNNFSEVGNDSTWTFTAVLDAWQLNAGNTDFSNGRGLQFQVRSSNGNQAVIGLKAGQTANVFGQVYSNHSGSVGGSGFSGHTSGVGATNTFWLSNPAAQDTKDLTMEITGDTSTGAWSARLSTSGSNTDNGEREGLVWTDLETAGTGLFSIADVQMVMLAGDTPANGWGSLPTAGNQPRNWVTLDSLSLSAEPVPEPSTYALLAGFAAFLFVAIRKRK